MPLSATLPPWLTQTPDPSAIIGRGSAAGGQAANARMDAERVMAQREQFAQEFTLRQAKLDMEAEAAAANLAAQDQELEIRRILGQSKLALDAQQSLQASQEYKLKADEAARKLMAQDQYLKTGDFDQYLRITSPAAAAQLQGRQLTADQRATAETQKAAAVKERTDLDRLSREKMAAGKPNTTLDRLEREIAGAQAELDALPKDKIIERRKISLQLENLRGQLSAETGMKKYVFDAETGTVK